MKIGNRLREARLAKDWNQRELASSTGITPTKISDYERDFSVPSLASLAKIADALDVTLDSLTTANLDQRARDELVDKDLLRMFLQVAELPLDDRTFMARVIRGLLLASRVQDLHETEGSISAPARGNGGLRKRR